MYDANLLITEFTRDRLRNASAFTLRDADRVTAKGKVKSVTIFEVVDADDAALADHKRATLPRYVEALALYRGRKFTDARKLFEELLAARSDDALAEIYRARSARYEAQPPPADWDGVEKLESK
jgi:adenylate cyclase